MKKILGIALVALLSLTLTACEATGDPETSSTEPANTQQQQESQTIDPTIDVLPNTEPEVTLTPEIPISDTVNEDMVTKLTPEGAEVKASEAGSLVLESDLGNDALKEFYLGVLPDLGVTEVETMDEEGMGWQYMGSYGEGKELTISIILLGETQNIAITY